MFLHLSVSHSVHGGSASVHAGTPLPGARHPPGADTPRADSPPQGAGTPEQAPPGAGMPPRPGTSPPGAGTPPTRHIPIGSRRLLLRTVRILLECILVSMHERKIAGNAEHKVMKAGFPNFLIFFLRNFYQKKWTGGAFLMTPRSAIDECSQIFPDEAHAQGN